ncbi:type VI secretion system baseplate subunit TssE [Arcobacter sp. FWKO B]|uniref:type VI secretion system baseplate subunit TssE n=1 Tax=Arcobacter sp. FWKO B TaxID=2593672 RepID=UPI0018A50701|nr:type VI secretion system baseplate subunit TssE [Arcobacter sp. FWKO B]QOG11550.1 type VI secretion system baseplate subunit TssE [Arcobacter sp. FWKO B]
MLYKGSLFEKITDCVEFKGLSKEEAMYKSIANNLSKIFSTNAGNAEIATDYGKPDLNNIELSQNESIEMIEKKAEICIRKYEPRLYNAKVGISRDKLQYNEMNIHIEGFLKIDKKSKKVTFKANLLSSGEIKVIPDDY